VAENPPEGITMKNRELTSGRAWVDYSIVSFIMLILIVAGAVYGSPPVAHIDIPEIGSDAQRYNIAADAGAKQYFVLEQSVTLWMGDLVNPQTGDFAGIDESLDGAWYNDSEKPAWLQTSDGNMVIIDPGTMFFIEPVDIESAGGGSKGCNTTCGNGYYACCNYGTAQAGPSCVCVQDALNRSCQTGGRGTTACSMIQ